MLRRRWVWVKKKGSEEVRGRWAMGGTLSVLGRAWQGRGWEGAGGTAVFVSIVQAGIAKVYNCICWENCMCH